MAAAWTSFRYATRLGMVATLTGVLLPLCGCATGTSASFTQAPLLFAEQTDPSGTATNLVVPDPETQESDPQVAATPVRVGSIGSGGGAPLPTAAVTSVTRPLGGVLAQVATVLPVSPVSVQAALSNGTVAVAIQTGILPPVNVQANLPGAVGVTTATLTQVATSVPVVSTVLQTPSVTGLKSTVGQAVAVVGSTTTALLQPVSAIGSPIASVASKPPAMPLPTAVGVAQSVAVTGTSLLTATSATLARICVLKGCR